MVPPVPPRSSQVHPNGPTFGEAPSAHSICEHIGLLLGPSPGGPVRPPPAWSPQQPLPPPCPRAHSTAQQRWPAAAVASTSSVARHFAVAGPRPFASTGSQLVGLHPPRADECGSRSS